MKPLYSVAQIRSIEVAAAEDKLMERAGLCAAQAVQALIPAGAPVLVLAGPGNNGGDALEAAAHLAKAGHAVTVIRFGEAGNPSPETQRALYAAQSSGVLFAAPEQLAGAWALVIDGLFGIGLSRPISGVMRAAVDLVNSWSCPVLALDVPSGLDADTGAVAGPDGIAIVASHTVTFIGDKTGLHTAQGRDHAGAVQVCGLDIDPARYPVAHAGLNAQTLFAACRRPRLHASHKGSYGDVMVIGGAHGMAGAAILAARAAARCGAGRVFAGFIDAAPLFDSLQPELMCRRADDLDLASATLVAGCGLGLQAHAHALLQTILATPAPLVLDADALNQIAADRHLQELLAQRQHPTILTPHPLEAARLLGIASSRVQADRLTAARLLAQQYQAVVVLKGSGTVIARPDGFCIVNTTGNPALATAGSGDVLAGICGALLAQAWPVWEAALGAVWFHGRAADVLVERGVGPIGLGAGELIPVVRDLLNARI